VVCDGALLRLVVELDDTSHQRGGRQVGDACAHEVLIGVGLPILHVRWLCWQSAAEQHPP
jgi:hypothetical protein